VNALHNLAAITATDGVDGVFFGPSDLAASMGLLGKSGAPPVQKSVLNGIETVRKMGKPAGVLTTDLTAAQRYLEIGALFVAVGVDTLLLVSAAQKLSAQFALK
jgi:4-hydroxy-2-oxoheptanedioate aldolase